MYIIKRVHARRTRRDRILYCSSNRKTRWKRFQTNVKLCRKIRVDRRKKIPDLLSRFDEKRGKISNDRCSKKKKKTGRDSTTPAPRPAAVYSVNNVFFRLRTGRFAWCNDVSNSKNCKYHKCAVHGSRETSGRISRTLVTFIYIHICVSVSFWTKEK